MERIRCECASVLAVLLAEKFEFVNRLLVGLEFDVELSDYAVGMRFEPVVSVVIECFAVYTVWIEIERLQLLAIVV